MFSHWVIKSLVVHEFSFLFYLILSAVIHSHLWPLRKRNMLFSLLAILIVIFIVREAVDCGCILLCEARCIDQVVLWLHLIFVFMLLRYGLINCFILCTVELLRDAKWGSPCLIFSTNTTQAWLQKDLTPKSHR